MECYSHLFVIDFKFPKLRYKGAIGEVRIRWHLMCVRRGACLIVCLLGWAQPPYPEDQKTNREESAGLGQVRSCVAVLVATSHFLVATSH